jgi:transcriptional regulator with XRE-family HTH domain
MQRSDSTKLTRTIGKRIAKIRAHDELSQSEFAEVAGISRGYLSDIERGAREMSVEVLDRV